MNIMEYVYDINNDIVRTYELIKDNNELYLQKISNIYLALRGDATIYDLRNRGYIEMSEVYEKYGVNSIEKKDKVKTKMLKKIR